MGDELAHQQLAQAAALEVGAHDDGELGLLVVGVGHGAGHAQGFLPACRVRGGGDEGHLALVVDLRQPRHLGVADAASAVEEAQAHVQRVQALDESGVLGFVLGPDRAQHQCSALPGDGFHQLLRVGPDGKALRASGGRGADPHPGVQREGALGVAQQRVDVDLGDARLAGQQLGDRQQGAHHGVDVGGRHIAPAVQQPGHACALDQRAGQRGVQRRQGHCPVGHHFHGGAALAEQQDRAELGVDAAADDELQRARPAHHGLHGEAFDDGVGPLLCGAHQHGLGGGGHLLLGLQVQRDTAHVALVRNLGGQHLQHHGKAQRARGLHGGLRRRPGDGGSHHGHAGCGQQGLGLGLGQHLAVLGQGAVDDGVGCGGRLGESWSQRRRLHQLELVAPVGGQHGKGPHSVFRRVVAGDAGSVEDLARLLHRLRAQPTGLQPAGGRAQQRAQFGHQGAGDVGTGHDGGGGMHEEHGAAARRLQQGAQGVDVARHRGVADDVHRVGARPVRRQRHLQRRLQGRRQRRQRHAFAGTGIGGQHAGAATVGHQHQGIGGGRLQCRVADDGALEVRQGFGGVEQVLQRVHAQHAGAADGGVQHQV